MNHTLVAVFNNRTDAQNAMNELVTSGFKREHLHLSGVETGNPAASQATTGGGLRHFFSGLFGEEHKQHVSRYESAVARGQHVVTLSAETLPDVERAADIVERYRPCPPALWPGVRSVSHYRVPSVTQVRVGYRK